MTTTMKRMLIAGALFALGACGNGSKGGGDMGPGGGGDMALPCTTNPMTNDDLLNACTTAQTGDPAKDSPYYPAQAPGGNLPPLP